jgi:probable rRNA maturation factor
MIELCILNEQELIDIDQELQGLLESIMIVCIQEEGLDFEGEVSLLFCNDATIKSLNHVHRQIDKKTDVLSFPQYEDLKAAIKTEPYINLGDVVISTDTAIEQAKSYNHSVLRELGFLFTHSMFHLMGYDHDTENNTKLMRSKEESVLNKINLRR